MSILQVDTKKEPEGSLGGTNIHIKQKNPVNGVFLCRCRF